MDIKLITIKFKSRNIKIEINSSCVGFEVLTVVVMKSSTFWDITPCSALKVNHCFRGIHCLEE
jgi:hypothetical protein